MQHEPWVGPRYEEGIAGTRVLIAAYSHWSDEGDNAEFTKCRVLEWAAGNEPQPFGTRLRAFFGNDEPRDFWNRVAFFNTLPRIIGGSDKRFEMGDKDQGLGSGLIAVQARR